MNTPTRGYRIRAATSIFTAAVTFQMLAVPHAFAQPTVPSGGTDLSPPVAVSPPESTSAAAPLTWGVRTSFNNYVGGPTFVTDGAQWANKTFTFRYKNKTWSEASQRLVVNYEGTIRYRKYCEGDSQDLGINCQLDLTLKDPSIVIEDAGSYIEATVSSKQYLTGEFYAPNKPVRIANISLVGGEAVTEGEQHMWKNLTTTITAEGVRMFSNFYNVGEALDPFSFGFSGDGPVFKAPQPGDLLTGAQWKSGEKYTDLHRVFSGPREGEGQPATVLVGIKGKGFRLLDSELKELAHVELPLNRYGAMTYEPQAQRLFFSRDADKGIYAFDVTTTGFDNPRKIADAPAVPLSMGVKKDGKVVIISAATGIENGKDAFMTILDGEKTKDIPLPDSSQLLGADIGQYSDSVYAPITPLGDSYDLAELADGSMVYNPYTDVSLNDKDETSKRGYLIRLNPEAESSEGAATLMKGSEVKDRSTYLDHMVVSPGGKSIIRFNTTDGDGSRVQVYDYADSDVVPAAPARALPGLGSIAAVGFQGDAPVIYEGKGGAMHWFDAHLTKENKKFPVPLGFKTEQKAHGSLLVREDGIFVPTVNAAAENSYFELYGLQKITIVQDKLVVPPSEEPNLTDPDHKQPGDDPGTVAPPNKQPDTQNSSSSWEHSKGIGALKPWHIVMIVLGLGGLFLAGWHWFHHR